MSPRAWIGRAALGLMGAILGFPWTPAVADRLHLAGGGVIEADSWWVEGGVTFYRSAAGTVGLPSALVVQIEPGGGSPAPSPRALPAPAAAAQPAAGPRRVSHEMAQRLDAANAALKRGDYATAASDYRVLMDETEADFIEPRLGFALSQVALGEDPLAHAVVLDALAREPRQPLMLELLGDIQDRRERVSDALAAWKEAFAAAPNDRLREKILKAERELQASRDYELDLSSHFNVRFDGAVDDELGQAVTDFLEEQYWVMSDLFDHAPRQPITVVLYPSRQFRDVTQAPEWVGGLYDGKIRVPLGGLETLDPRASALLRHELTHAFVHARSRGRSPRWLHEGLAQHLEGRALSRADRQQNFSRLRARDPADWEQGGFSYPLALSLTSYLVDRRGFDVLVDVLRELGEGVDPDTALSRAYGADYASLCRDWGTAVLAEGGR